MRRTCFRRLFSESKLGLREMLLPCWCDGDLNGKRYRLGVCQVYSSSLIH